MGKWSWLVALVLAGCGAKGDSGFQGAATPGTSAQECTIHSDGPNYPDGGAPCGGDVSCNGPEDCSGGKSCCVTTPCGGNVYGYAASCTDTCNLLDVCAGVGTDWQRWRLCLSTTDCPSGLTCQKAPFPNDRVLLSTQAGICR